MWKIEEKSYKFSLYYAEFQGMAADHSWKTLAQRNALLMVLLEEMQTHCTYGNVPGELHVFVTVCNIWDNKIC